jgi:hypothetical protein
MELLIIVIIVLCGGNRKRLGEMKPYLCDIGVQPNAVEKAEKALSEAEEVEGVISAVQSIAGAGGAKNDFSSIFSSFFDGASSDGDMCDNVDENEVESADDNMNEENCEDEEGENGCNFALEPIINIANDEIISSLCRYFCVTC